MAEKRLKSPKHPGVYYYNRTKNGNECKYYVIRYYNKNTKKYKEEAIGYHSKGINPSTAFRILNELKANISKNEGFQSLEGKRQLVFEEEMSKSTSTFDLLWEEYVKTYYNTNHKDLKGLRTDKSRYNNYISPIIGKQRPEDVSHNDMNSIRTMITQNGLAPKTHRNILELIRRLSSWAESENRCNGLKFKIKMPFMPNNIMREALTFDQINQVVKVLENYENKTVANIIFMALLTGMRKSEIINLKWVHLDFNCKMILLEKKITKSGEDKFIPLNNEVEKILNKQKFISGKTEFVFPTPKGTPYKDIRRHLNRYKQLAGLDKNFRPMHGLRQTYATIANSIAGAYITKELLTHGDVAVTDRYINPITRDVRSTSDKVAGKIINN